MPIAANWKSRRLVEYTPGRAVLYMSGTRIVSTRLRRLLGPLPFVGAESLLACVTERNHTWVELMFENGTSGAEEVSVGFDRIHTATKVCI